MHIVIFQGGLGNQLFEYSFYHKYQSQGKKMSFYFLDGNSHNGFELPKWFEVNLKPAPSFLCNMYKCMLPAVRRNLRIPFLFDYEETFSGEPKCLYQIGYWQDKKYLEKDVIKFKALLLSEVNQDVVNMMNKTESVAIHVRRGDYLRPPYDKIYGNVCTLDYYRRAIDIVSEQFRSPNFFVFSDDIQWVKENLPITDATFITWNSGENSIFDMYLMSKAKANIIANSTFSYWGAKLNENNRMVVYPQKWFNSQYDIPNIFPTNWIGI